MGSELTADKVSAFLQEQIKPHKNRVAIRNRSDEIAVELQDALRKSQTAGVRDIAEKKDIARTWLNLAISCAKIPVKIAADQFVELQKQQTDLIPQTQQM